MGEKICFWNEEFIRFMVLKEFRSNGKTYNNTLFLDLMKKRVEAYLNSQNILDKELFNSFFKKDKSGKYFQVEQRKLLQTEKRKDGVPESLAKIISSSYEYEYKNAFFTGENAIGVSAASRKKYLDNSRNYGNKENKNEFGNKWFSSNVILKAYPSIINSKEIEGFWLSRFSYTTKRNGETISSFQYDLERLIAYDENLLFGSNFLCLSPSGKEYFHDLRVQIVHSYLIGTWYNNNTKNIGVMQLYIHTNNIIMTGKHLGNSNDNSIQEGEWNWIKIKAKESDEAQIKSKKLRQIDVREDIYNKRFKSENMINLTDIIQ